jgi:glutamate transport system permease protein
MDVLVDNADLILKGFWETLQLVLVSGAYALVLGTLVAVARVSPVGVLRGVGTAYVTLFRNTPLLILMIITSFGLPELGIDFGSFPMLSIALGVYTSTFVAEALRSGINGVPLGQAEAARAIGMPFGQTMRHVVLPQAGRLVVPPVASALIALVKNTSLVAVFGLADATFRMRGLLRDYAADRWAIFIGIALGYVIIVEVISLIASAIERRWKVVAR